MRVLILHNRYRYTGGEDSAVDSEARALEQHGIEVIRPEFDNEIPGRFPILGTLALAARSAWSQDSYDQVSALCAEHRPDVVHVHNSWMRISPSVHSAAQASGAATVQSLHNHRLSCVNGTLLRDGRPCDECIGNVPWRGVMHRCQHGSLLQSAAVARMVMVNRRRRTWMTDVDAFIAPSEFARSKALAGGIAGAQTFVKPNATTDPGEAPTPAASCSTAVFAGRLSREKGIDVLLEAWALTGRDRNSRRLMIIGDGPERLRLEARAAQLGLQSPQVEFTGRLEASQVKTALLNARLFILPSLCGETFGTSIVEAFACGRPAIVTALGGQSEVVQDGITGIQVAPADAGNLAAAIATLYATDTAVAAMGQRARNEFLARYTPQQNFRALLEIYRFAMSRRSSRIPSIPTREEVAC